MTLQLALGTLGLLNVYVLWLLNRRTKASDEHKAQHKKIEEKQLLIENQIITEESFRRILKEELRDFELRLINEGRLDPQRRRKH